MSHKRFAAAQGTLAVSESSKLMKRCACNLGPPLAIAADKILNTLFRANRLVNRLPFLRSGLKAQLCCFAFHQRNKRPIRRCVSFSFFLVYHLRIQLAT